MIVQRPIRDDLRDRPLPPVRPYRYRLKTRWGLIRMQPPTSWADAWDALRFLVRG